MIKSNEGFIHSVRVPRIYKVASMLAKDHSEGKGSIKNLLFHTYQKKHPNLKAIFSLVSTLFARANILENLLKRSSFFLKEPRCDPWLTKVLIVELLWGKGRLPGQSKPESQVRAYEQVFKAHLSDYKDLPDDTHEETWKPRYVRVNTLKLPFEEAVKNFQDGGWELLELSDPSDYDEFLDTVSKLEARQFVIDIHIPNLLVFAPKTEFYNHPAYKTGCIILQDKASCIPVYLLSPPSGSVVLDMCAAPGMKTTHVAAVLGNKGKVHAIERHPDRFEMLCNIVESAGASCVELALMDVLSCNGKDFPDVEYIIVDPSCTGSGMTKRGHNLDRMTKDDRIKSLAGFQIKILRSAFLKYPKVKRIVYSTCSIYPEENEEVVREVLETSYRMKLVPVKKLLEGWKNFGTGDIGKLCLYAKPDVDLTDGFFTAVFERLEEGETNQFFNEEVYNTKLKIQQEKRNFFAKKGSRGKDKFSETHEEMDHEEEDDKNWNKVESNAQKDDLVINSVKNHDVTIHNKPRKSKKNKTKNTSTEFNTNSNAPEKKVPTDLAPRKRTSSNKNIRSEDQSYKEPQDSFAIQVEKMLEKLKGKLEAQVKEESEKSKVKVEALKEEIPDQIEPPKKKKDNKDQSCKEPQDRFITDLKESTENLKMRGEVLKVPDEIKPRIDNSFKKKKKKDSKDQSCKEPQDLFIINLEESSENPKLKVEALKNEVSDEFELRIDGSTKKKKNKGSKEQSCKEPQDRFIIDLKESTENPKMRGEALKEEVTDGIKPRIDTSFKKKKKKDSKDQPCKEPQDLSIINLEESSGNPELKVEALKNEVSDEFELRIDGSTKEKKNKGKKDPSCKEPLDLEENSEDSKVKVEILKNEVVDVFEPGITSSIEKRKNSSKDHLYAEPQDPFIIESKPKVEKIPEKSEPRTNNSSKKKSSEEPQDKTELNLDAPVLEDSSYTVNDEKLGSNKKKRKSNPSDDDSAINVEFSAKISNNLERRKKVKLSVTVDTIEMD